MTRRTCCIICDKYFTPKTNGADDNMCDKCRTELGVVKSDLAERTLKELKSKFKS